MNDQLGISAFQAYTAPKQTIKSLANSVKAKAEVFKLEEGSHADKGKNPAVYKIIDGFCNFVDSLVINM